MYMYVHGSSAQDGADVHASFAQHCSPRSLHFRNQWLSGDRSLPSFSTDLHLFGPVLSAWDDFHESKQPRPSRRLSPPAARPMPTLNPSSQQSSTRVKPPPPITGLATSHTTSTVSLRVIANNLLAHNRPTGAVIRHGRPPPLPPLHRCFLLSDFSPSDSRRHPLQSLGCMTECPLNTSTHAQHHQVLASGIAPAPPSHATIRCIPRKAGNHCLKISAQ